MMPLYSYVQTTDPVNALRLAIAKLHPEDKPSQIAMKYNTGEWEIMFMGSTGNQAKPIPTKIK